METVIIKPLKQRQEILFVSISSIAIILIASLLIFFRNNEGSIIKKLKPYQISVFSELSTIEQGIFTDLYTAAFDIDIFHLDNAEEWPSVETISDNLIAPFAKNAVWKNRGSISWELKTMDKDKVHRSVYIGRSFDAKISGSFILFLEHFHTMDGAYFYGINKKQPFKIWYKKGAFRVPKDFSDGTLISTGWKEAIPYRGKDVLKRLKRGK